MCRVDALAPKVVMASPAASAVLAFRRNVTPLTAITDSHPNDNNHHAR